MKTTVALALIMTLGYSGLMAQDETTYRITFTNLTAGQQFTSPVIVVHNANYQLFTPGKRASNGLASLAEDGITGRLSNEARGKAGVLSVQTGSGFAPGKSISFDVTTSGNYMYLSAVGMLAATNDAFYAVRGLKLSEDGLMAYGNAWDAGSEENNESADFVPGIGGKERKKKGSERMVHIHPGVHGIADLDPGVYDWRNPVLLVTVEKIN